MTVKAQASESERIRAHSFGVELDEAIVTERQKQEAQGRREFDLNRALTEELIAHNAYLRREQEKSQCWCYAWAAAAITMAIGWTVWLVVKQ